MVVEPGKIAVSALLKHGFLGKVKSSEKLFCYNIKNKIIDFRLVVKSRCANEENSHSGFVMHYVMRYKGYLLFLDFVF